MADETAGRLDENEEFEEITSDEVDRVVEQLEKLIETVSSENIKAYLEEAVNNVFFLLYDDEDMPRRREPAISPHAPPVLRRTPRFAPLGTFLAFLGR